MKTTTKPRILGTTDEVTTCECCLRQDLAKTVAIDFDGEVAFFGTTCAVAYLTANFAPTTEREVRTEARKVDEAKREAERKAKQAAHDAEFARQQSELDQMFPDIAGQQNRLAQVCRLRERGMSITEV